jgi:hypothetical protein
MYVKNTPGQDPFGHLVVRESYGFGSDTSLNTIDKSQDLKLLRKVDLR